MSRRLVRLLSSLRFTLVLIISLSVIFLLGLWIPQKGLLKRDLYLQWKAESPGLVSALEAFGLTNIHTSPITLTLWALFFCNLCLVMWKQASVVRSRISIPLERFKDPRDAAGYTQHASVSLADEKAVYGFKDLLKRRGYKWHGSMERFYAVKNRLSPMATLLFHLSFILILFGGVVSIYTKFSATVDIAEGEEFTSMMEAYNPVPRLPKVGSVPRVRFMVEKITPVVEKNTPVATIVQIIDEKGARHTAEINRPYKTDYTSFVINDIGVAPLIILEDRHGRELDGAYVKLNVMLGKQDSFEMHGLEFEVQFYPDYIVVDGKEMTRSEEIVNPTFSFYIQKDKKFIARRTLRPGESVEFGDYRLVLPEFLYWVRFYVVKERGLGLVYAGFGIATAALVWRLIFYRREIIGTLVRENGKAVLHIAGRAEFYRELFSDEFKGFVGGLGHNEV